MTVIEDRIFSEIKAELSSSHDFQGEVARSFEQLLLLTLHFARDRLDAQRATLGDRGSYLFASENDDYPLEKELGFDYRDFLVGSRLGHCINAEVRDVSGGRADVLVNFVRYRFVAELKRELADSSREAIASYLGQTASYQGADLKLGFLLVLDLTDKSEGYSHLEQNVWLEKVQFAEGDYRYVVVVRIIGNRITPSQTQTPSQKHSS